MTADRRIEDPSAATSAREEDPVREDAPLARKAEGDEPPSAGPPSAGRPTAGLPFGAGLVGSAPSRKRNGRASEPDPPASEEPEPSGVDAEELDGPGNLVAGRSVASLTGHVFRDGEGRTWPRSGEADVAAVVRSFPATPAALGAPPRSADAAEAIAKACASDEALRAELESELGAIAEGPRFRPAAADVLDELAALARGPRDADVPDHEIVAIGLHWSEPLARAAGKLLRAISRGASVLLATDPRTPRVGLTLARALEDAGVGTRRLAVLHDDGRDVLRGVAALSGVALDAVRPDAFVTGIVGRLTSIREAASAEPSGDGAAPADEPGWFGHGVVERPPAPLRVRAPRGTDVVVGDLEVPTDGEVLRLGADDLVEAAEQVVERAFGTGAMGGYADDAVARVYVERHVFSRFTECVLDVLEDADGDPWFDPPGCVFDGADRMPLALSSARRIGLDEGATLVHERASKRAGRRGGAVVHGLVFTNVEPRMRLGGALRAPGVLSLIRGVGADRR